ncbi:MAG TPA: M13 family metallopeptidase [Caulobacteraceae bacterium]
MISWNALGLLAAIVAVASIFCPPAHAQRAASAPMDVQGMDLSVAPGDDFFGYVNGGWLKRTEIPDDRSSYGLDASLVELTDQRTVDLIGEAARANPPAGSDERKIADYYGAYMDEGAIEAAGLAPLAAALRRVAAIADARSLAGELGGEMRADVDVMNDTRLHTDRLFGLWVAQDLDVPAHYTAFLIQGGLGMPDRDYYLDPSPAMAAIRAAYRTHIAAVLSLAGIDDPQGKATAILALERRIARVHASRTDSDQVRKGDNPWVRRDFETRAPGLDWNAYFAAARLARQGRFIVWQPGALIGISALTASEPLATWKAWLAFHIIDRASPVLSKAFVDEHFAFYGRTLSGTPVINERWKRAVAATNEALGDAVGRLYVARWFPPQAKAQVQALVDNLIVAFGIRIDALTWMAPQTKARAKAKLAGLQVGVGYPDKWRDYSGLAVTSGDALGNLERAEMFEYRRNLGKLSAPVDRTEWVMTPQTVNAVNLPAMNALNFPAAYLQPPLFDPAASAAANYGGIGATIGHEISHSFDDQGALFDASGRLANWWTPGDFAHFQASAAQLVRQFDAYRPFPDLAVSGAQTLSENIADVAGLAVSHDAYRLSLHGRPAPQINGFTGDQQFFIAFGASWRTKVRDAALRQDLLTDGHAPAQYRADTVRNIDGWYAAFDVKPGQTLYLEPADRVRMW